MIKPPHEGHQLLSCAKRTKSFSVRSVALSFSVCSVLFCLASLLAADRARGSHHRTTATGSRDDVAIAPGHRCEMLRRRDMGVVPMGQSFRRLVLQVNGRWHDRQTTGSAPGCLRNVETARRMISATANIL